jgi:hypothetical protein
VQAKFFGDDVLEMVDKRDEPVDRRFEAVERRDEGVL